MVRASRMAVSPIMMLVYGLLLSSFRLGFFLVCATTLKRRKEDREKRKKKIDNMICSVFSLYVYRRCCYSPPSLSLFRYGQFLYTEEKKIVKTEIYLQNICLYLLERKYINSCYC